MSKRHTIHGRTTDWLDNGGPGEHDARFLDDDPVDLSPCPRCMKAINAYSWQCCHCGTEFSRQAWQLGDSRRAFWGGHWLKIVTVLVLLMAMFYVLGLL